VSTASAGRKAIFQKNHSHWSDIYEYQPVSFLLCLGLEIPFLKQSPLLEKRAVVKGSQPMFCPKNGTWFFVLERFLLLWVVTGRVRKAGMRLPIIGEVISRKSVLVSAVYSLFFDTLKKHFSKKNSSIFPSPCCHQGLFVPF